MRMKLLVFAGAILTGASLVPAAIWIGDRALPRVDRAVGQNNGFEARWRWSDERASLDFCVKSYLPDYDLQTTPEADSSFYYGITISAKRSGRVVYHLQGGAIVFTRKGDTLFIAEFNPMTTGCTVVAVDLKTGSQIWKTDLQGIGPTGHSKYLNKINIENDGKRVIVYGNEAHGKYVETLDIESGKTLSNFRFDLSVKR